MGNMSTINTVLSDEDIELICMNFNVEVHKEVVVDEDDIEEQLQNVEEDESKLVPRPPVAVSYTHLDVYKRQVLGLGLGVADKYLKVEADVRVEKVTSLLPGYNCGGCGFPGCRCV